MNKTPVPSRHRETLGGQVVAPSSGRPNAEGPAEDDAVAPVGGRAPTPNVPMGPTHIRPDLGGSGLGLDADTETDGVSGSSDPSTDRPTALTRPIASMPESEPRPRAEKAEDARGARTGDTGGLGSKP